MVSKFESSPKAEKPVILHSLKVAFRLIDCHAPLNAVIGGVLHDLIEDANVNIDDIKKEFGLEVAELVEAGSLDYSIKDYVKRYQEMFNRTLGSGREAMLIKAADILENSYYKLAPSQDKKEKLREKVRYFLEISKKSIGRERIYKILQNRLLQLKSELSK
jgi:GTP pyrophosphokinase